MTRDKAINILARLAGGATQPSWEDIKNAAKFAYDVLSGQPEEASIQFNDVRTFKPYQSIKRIMALGFMKVLDEIRPENKMCLSNGECMDIEKAFDQQDWEKLEGYLKKYSPNQ